MLLLLLESVVVATTSAGGFLFATGIIFVSGVGATVGVVGGFDLHLVDVCCCCFHDSCLSWPSRSTSSLRWFMSKRMGRLCRTKLCFCFMFGWQGRFVVFIFVFVFLGLWFLDFNFVFLDLGLCSYCSCPIHRQISINVIFCFYLCF